MGTVPYSLIQEFFTTSVEFAVSFFLSRKFEGDVTFSTTIKIVVKKVWRKNLD